MSDNIISVICIIIFVAIMGFVSYKCFKKAYNLKQAQTEAYNRFGATMNGTLKHIEGLPLASGVPVEVYYGAEKIVFKKDQHEISISRNKVTGIDVTTGKDIKMQQMAGATAGKFILGGMTGAVLGSLVATSTYLVISYTSDKENRYVILDTAASGMFALKVQKDFAKTNDAKRTTIEL